MTAHAATLHAPCFVEPSSWPALDASALPKGVLWGEPLRPARRHVAAASTAASSGLAVDPRSKLPKERLQPIATSWMQQLPLMVRPGLTAKRHPQVVNRLAAAWDDPSKLREVFASLLLSDRIDRKGFDLTVLDELLTVQAYSQERRRG